MTFFTIDDDQIPVDTRDVLDASALLQITEFHLFELAFERWFGREAREAELEPCFARYMFAAIAPFWVRQFCREVADRDSDGTLNPRDFGVFPRVICDTWARRMLRHATMMLFLVIALHLIAILISTV